MHHHVSEDETGRKPGEITFVEFARAMSALSGRNDAKTKMEFAFNLFDLDGGGSIMPDEMFAPDPAHGLCTVHLPLL